MSDFLQDPSRWKDRTDQVRLSERAAGQMVRGLGTAEPLSAVQLARIAARVRAQRPRPRRLRLWVPVTAVLFFGGVAAASAAGLDILPSWLINIVRPGAVAPAPQPPALRSAQGRPTLPPTAPAPAPDAVLVPAPAPATQAEPVPTVQAPPAVQPAVAPQPVSTLGPNPGERTREPIRKPTARTVEAKSSHPTAKVTSSSPAQPVAAQTASTAVAAHSAAVAEPVPPLDLPTHPIAPVATTMQLAWVDPPPSIRREPARPMADPRQAAPAPSSQGAAPVKYLSAAIRALRVEHAPTTALALLDRHAGDLEKSSVSHEALLLRVEAMLKLERQTEVLKLLDAAPMAGVAASRALLLTRGELRAAANRCAEAIIDFDLVLVQTQGRNKRALAGRAKCQKPVDAKTSTGAVESGAR